jgi:hypothetical protein
MKKFKFLKFFFVAIFFLQSNGYGQANPSIAVVPLNSGLVSLGATLDLEITVGNTGVSNIPAIKLRPVITVPAIVNILPNIQQTGLPPGWSIVTNTGSQIRICNGADVIGGSSSRTIFIKVQGVSIGGPTTFSGQINFANGVNCANAGTSVSGNNTADDFSTSTVQVVAGCNLGINATAGTILCNGGSTTVTVTASAATGPLEYSITGGEPYQTSNVFTNVVAGTYTVTAREVENPLTCVASAIVSLTEPPPVPVPSVNIIQPTCTVTNGIVTVTSATTGLVFSLDGTSFSEYPAGGYLLSSGSYTLIARNTNNCLSSTATFTVDPQPLTPATPVIGTVTQPNCTLSTGSIELNNLPAGSWIIEPGTIIGNTNSAMVNNLAAGSYSFTVTNSAGCTSLPSANVDIIAVAGAPDAPLVTLTQPTCTVATGNINIVSSLTGLIFSLDGAAFAPYPTGGYSGIFSGTHTLSAQNLSGCSSPVVSITINAQPASPSAPTVSITQPTCTVSTGIIIVSSLTTDLTFSLVGGPFAPYPCGGYITTSGVHTLAVQNGSGCTPNSTNNIVINAQPATPSLSLAFTPITCFGANSIITVTAMGGVLPYEYNINAGVFQNTNEFTIGAGSHTIAVKDFNGCIGTNNLLITQPTVITATASATPIACNGGNASLTVLATGGFGTYEYNLNNGTYQSGNTFTVAAGTYSVKVRLTDNPGCSTTVNTVLNVSQPAVLKATATARPIEYCGGNTVVNISATGGTPPYRDAGNFVKGPGNWNFIVLDTNGCSASADVLIFSPGCVDIKVFPNPAQNAITVNHSASSGSTAFLEIISENGVRMLSYAVPRNNFITTLNISRLAAGNYILLYSNGEERKETKFIKMNN